jgi:putative membrane protein
MTEPKAPDGDRKRTSLALERTQLAWWRTGMTSLAVGIGVGRVVPELQDSKNDWAYVALGVAYALYGLALIAFGTIRERSIKSELADGSDSVAKSAFELVMAVGAMGLAVATALLILLG